MLKHAVTLPADPMAEDPTRYLKVPVEMARETQTMPYDSKKSWWIPDTKEGFVLGEKEEMNEEQEQSGPWIFRDPKGEIREVKREDCHELNPPKYEKCEDMSTLTYLNDASVLHNLRQRYYTWLIYTYSGLFCVAINPYKRLPIYKEEVVNSYHGKRRSEMPPHVFAVSDNAYGDMLSNKENQSMLITGESGAGKTENTKKVISYFAIVAKSTPGLNRPENILEKEEKKGTLEDQVVQTNPVLETFGNAKTVRNDNSSRFGKFIRIHFNQKGKLAGADIEVYLLEKARVVSQQSLERSYHVFYQMMSGAIDGLKKKLLLEGDITDYHFVSQGKTSIEGVDDAEEMRLTDNAFDILGFSEDEKNYIYKIVASVMHFGEMKFKQRGEQAEIDSTMEGERVAHLLGIQDSELFKGLVKPRIKVRNEYVTQGRTKDQVVYSIGGLSKAIYERVFRWLVVKCNETLEAKSRRQFFIGVLDIAGFEIFEYNGFEQLCINFTNEKLQQYFNHHMFVLEQEEYRNEGIEWTFIDFGMDLQGCIDLIEKPMGVLAILEEECHFPKASDKTFLEKLMTNHLGKSPNFEKAKPAKKSAAESHFGIIHYAGTVNYNIDGWLDKNKDPLNETVCKLLANASNKIVKILFHDYVEAEDDTAKKGGRGKKGASFLTVSAVYREQLNKLMTTLRNTSPHFVRCIIPNEIKAAGEIDAALVMTQLTCNGVLEGIRICRKGFPNRMVYGDFVHRYQILAPNAVPEGVIESKAKAQAVLKDLKMDENEYKLGHTKVFFKAGVLGYLEDQRDEALTKIIIKLQSVIRMQLGMQRFARMKEQRDAIEIIQYNVRAYLRIFDWPWWRLFTKVKPMLTYAKTEELLQKKEKELEEAKTGWEKEEKMRRELEEALLKITRDRDDLFIQLQAESGNTEEAVARAEQLYKDKEHLEQSLNDLKERLKEQEQESDGLVEVKRNMQTQIMNMQADMKKMEMELEREKKEKEAKDQQINQLRDEIAKQDQLINKITKEKKDLEDSLKRANDNARQEEEKLSIIQQQKLSLENKVDQLEDSWARERKSKEDLEKVKTKLETDMKLLHDTVDELDRAKRELQATMLRKDKDISSFKAQIDEQSSLIAKLQKRIKELESRIQELEEELDQERSARSKVEKQKAELSRELDDLHERLEDAGGATAAQLDLNKRREAELAKLKRELENTSMQSEQTISTLRKKHQDSLTDLADQNDQLTKAKQRLEMSQEKSRHDLEDIRSSFDHVTKGKQQAEKLYKNVESQLGDLQSKLDIANRQIAELSNYKMRVSSENNELSRQVDDANAQIASLEKLKSQLQAALDETKTNLEEEMRTKQAVAGQLRNALREAQEYKAQVDEEIEGRSELQRQLAKAQSEAQMWKSKYESEGLHLTEELEEAKRKLLLKLQESEERADQATQKSLQLEKVKIRLQNEVEDATISAEKANANAAQLEKKQRAFDKIVAEWKSKCDDVAAELEASQKEARGYSAEIFKIRQQLEEANETADSLRRENKNLADEVKDLMEQLGEGGRNLHEVEKARKRLELEKNELESALAEAESALEAEESKVLRAQLELTNIRSEIERRLAEKEDEFEQTRKNHQRALESIQATLENESKGKQEALRAKKKLETDINQLEVALDNANKAAAEAQRTSKKYQDQVKQMQAMLEDEQIRNADLREQLGATERKIAMMNGEMDELRQTSDQKDRSIKQMAQDMHELHGRYNDVNQQNSNLVSTKRKLEGEISALHVDLEENMKELINIQDKSKKAISDAARLTEELRQEQEHSIHIEKQRKSLEQQVKDLQVRLDEAESHALKGGRKLLEKLQEKIRQLEAEVDAETKKRNECEKQFRKADRRSRELLVQGEEDRRNNLALHEMIEKLQAKIKAYKRQVEEVEEIANINLAKYRKLQSELEDAEERADVAEGSLSKFRTHSHAGTIPPPGAGRPGTPSGSPIPSSVSPVNYVRSPVPYVPQRRPILDLDGDVDYDLKGHPRYMRSAPPPPGSYTYGPVRLTPVHSIPVHSSTMDDGDEEGFIRSLSPSLYRTPTYYRPYGTGPVGGDEDDNVIVRPSALFPTYRPIPNLYDVDLDSV